MIRKKDKDNYRKQLWFFPSADAWEIFGSLGGGILLGLCAVGVMRNRYQRLAPDGEDDNQTVYQRIRNGMARLALWTPIWRRILRRMHNEGWSFIFLS